jgi:hypothetical protein
MSLGLKIPTKCIRTMISFCENQGVSYRFWSRIRDGEEWHFKTEADLRKASSFMSILIKNKHLEG